MVGILYVGHDELYRHAKFGEIEQRAPSVGAKMWCLYVCFFCHAARPARCSFDGGRLYFEQVLCRCLWVDFEAAKNSNNNSV